MQKPGLLTNDEFMRLAAPNPTAEAGMREVKERAAYDRLRDRFVAQIASGLVVGTDLVKSGHFPDHALAAKFCYDAADALVEEKKRRDAARKTDA
jgi:hypothetical protein